MHLPRLLTIATASGAIPLLSGTLIYVTWRLTRLDWLMFAGYFTIIIGIIAFFAGIAALLRHLWHEWRVERTTRTPLWLQAVLVGGLLLMNVPVAAFFTVSAIDVATRYTVTVYNESEQSIESLVVTGPGVHIELGPIAPGQKARRYFHFEGDGKLIFNARQQEAQFSGELESYVTGGGGGTKSIRIKQKGVYEIQANAA